MVRAQLDSPHVPTTTSSRCSCLRTYWSPAILAILGLAVWAVPLFAQVIESKLCGTDGTVYSVAHAGNTLYIGGYFNVVGTPTGGGIPLDRDGGAPAGRFPRVCGIVHIAIPDGDGGWFIGGYFSSVEGQPRSNVAHVLANGDLAAWAPIVWGESRRAPFEPIHPAVHALMLRGKRLYIGGRFSAVNGVSRNNIALLDARTGELLQWNPGADGEVRCLEARGARLYAGGGFTVIGDSTRARLAVFDERSGRLTPWHPAFDGTVLVMAMDGDRLYVGGQFDHVDGVERNSIAALDARTGAIETWDATLAPRRVYLGEGNWVWPYVEGIVVHGSAVYLAGWFDHAGGQPRDQVAALDTRTAKATRFDARLAAGSPDWVYFANSVAVSGRTVYVGGTFGFAGGQPRTNLAALDAVTGDAMPWNPRAAGTVPGGKVGAPWDPRQEGCVLTLAPSGDRVYAGGSFTHMYDWQTHGFAAAIDLTTGKATGWNPIIEGLYVTRLAVVGNSVYLTGAFRKVNGEPRDNAAAVDAVTGALLPWNLGNAYTLATHDDQLYVGGFNNPFTGSYADYVAPVDLSTGAPLTWIDYVTPSYGVETMLATDAAIYLGGEFSNVGSVARRTFAALDPVSGRVLPWAPAMTYGYVSGHRTFAITAIDSAVYVSGDFIAVDDQPRAELAAVDATTGGLLPWAPNADDLVEALAAGRNAIWAGGRFANIGGAPRAYLAALDPASGAPTAWDAQTNGEVLALAASGDTVFVGGAFQNMQGFPRGGVGVILPAGSAQGRAARVTQAPESRPPAFTWSAVDPIRNSGAIRFTLQTATLVSIGIFDVQGRRIASLLDRSAQPAGVHELTFSTHGWAPGVYLCRFESGTTLATKKLMVVR